MYNLSKNIIKIIPKLGVGFLISFFLFFAHPINMSAGAVVFAGKIFYKAPSTMCNAYPACAGACAPCGCGPWSDNILLPVYGVAPGWIPFLCQADAAIAFGTAPMLPMGSTVLGTGAMPWVFTIDGVVNNIWGTFQ